MASSGAPLATIYAIPVPTSTTEENALPTAIIAATGMPSAPRNTYTVPASSTNTAAAAPSSSASASTLPIGAKVAIGVAIPLAVLALIVWLFLLFRRRKQKILEQSREPEYDLTFSPAPTHTTFMDKERQGSRVDSRAETLNNSRMASRLDSRSNSRLGSHHTESRSGSRQESYKENRIGSPQSFYKPSMSPSPTQQSHHYVAELASPDLKSPTENRYPTYPIHEIGPGKGYRGTDEESIAESDHDPIVYEIVELPDTSRRSIKNWHRSPSTASNESRPTIRDMGDRRKIPIPPVPEDDEGERSWLQPTTPPATKASFI